MLASRRVAGPSAASPTWYPTRWRNSRVAVRLPGSSSATRTVWSSSDIVTIEPPRSAVLRRSVIAVRGSLPCIVAALGARWGTLAPRSSPCGGGPPLQQVVDQLQQGLHVHRLREVALGPEVQHAPDPVRGGVGAEHHDLGIGEL